MSDTYIKGFNEGYVIAEHLPDLAQDLSKVNISSPWIEGFRDGRSQYVFEQTKELRPAWLTVDRDKSQNRDYQQDQTNDREGRDIER
jgi:hypothetical protein